MGCQDAAAHVGDGHFAFGYDVEDGLGGIGIDLECRNILGFGNAHGCGLGGCSEHNIVHTYGHAVLSGDGDGHLGGGVAQPLASHVDGGVAYLGDGFDSGGAKSRGVSQTYGVVEVAFIEVGHGSAVHVDAVEPGTVDEDDVVDRQGVVTLASSGRVVCGHVYQHVVACR